MKKNATPLHAASAGHCGALHPAVNLCPAMHTLIQTIEVNQPLRTVYNQWTQFEEFPAIMGSIMSVKQVSSRILHVSARIAGVLREWDAEIREQVPDRCISWRSIRGPRHSGTITFQPVSVQRTRMSVLINFEPAGMLEKMAAALGIIDICVESNLRQFKRMIEFQGISTGAWRGEIHDGKLYC